MNKKIKKLIVVISFLVLIVSFNVVYASEGADPQNGTSMNNSEEEKNSLFSLFSRETKDPYTGKHYVHNSRFDGNEIKYGIDVSKYNGSIDWKKVKKDGIEYAMIRVGYRSYGANSKLYKDPKFDENVKGALNAGIKVGVYFYSQAITRAEANEEADFVVDQIRKYNITLPVAIDFEYASTSSGATGRLYNANLSKKNATNVCKGFCSSVKAEGYVPMVYANKSMLLNHLNADELSDRYMIWISNYTTETSYTGAYSVWQYSSKGSVDGVSGNVDCNFWYEESENTYDGIDYSAVYNYDYYITHNPDIKKVYGDNRRAALSHFVNNGMNEGRQACEEFNVNTYKNRYPDLRNAYGDNKKSYYMHYINSGKKEGRSGKGTSGIIGTVTKYGGVDYSAVYNYQYYISHNADIKRAYGEDDVAVLRHFVNSGMIEGRQGSEEFNVTTYKNRYSDLRIAYGKNTKNYYMHYIRSGKTEGRSGKGTSELVGLTRIGGVDYSAVYNYQYYIAHNADIKRVYGEDDVAVLKHFVNSGMSEGRQGSEEFNVSTYKNRYPDLRIAYGKNTRNYYTHYIRSGKKEGRSGKGTSELVGLTRIGGVDYSAVYNYQYYIGHNADIKRAYGEDDVAALRHFVNSGMSEGRQGNEEFNVDTYKKRYRDLRNAYGNNKKNYYMHYIWSGKKEGRSGKGTSELIGAVTKYNGVDYSAVYDYEYYLEKNPDVEKVYDGDDIATLEYFVTTGMSEGHIANTDFDVHYYKDRYADLRRAYGSDLKKYYLHYMNHGKSEGRVGADPEADSDTIYNGIDYKDVYDYEYYREHNEDVKETCGDDKRATLIHFVKYGMKEGQIASETFDVHYYKDSNSDLQEKYGEDWEQYYLHYINIGKRDGRKGFADSSSDSDKKDSIVEKENVVSDDLGVKNAEMDSLTDNDLEGATDEKIEKSEDENPIDENADKEVDNEEIDVEDVYKDELAM